MREQFVDTITLRTNRGLVWGNRLADSLGSLPVITEESLESLGLFDSSAPNYVSFSPGTSKEDFTPKDEDFVYSTFRLLSETVVHRTWNPIDFSKPGVLKASMPLLLNQVVYPDHEPLVGNGLGVVNKVFWSEGYKLGDKVIPPGIEAELKIDGVANPKIARQLLMRPPAIHSTSVTVNFAWEKSHDLSTDDFYSKLGSFMEDGTLVRKVVTKIMQYYENSLVPHGADEFAKIIDNGKILNANMLAEVTKNSRVFFMDFTGKFEKLTDNVSLNFKQMNKKTITVEAMAKLLTDSAKLSIPEGLKLEDLSQEEFQKHFITPIVESLSSKPPENYSALIAEYPDLTLEEVQTLKSKPLVSPEDQAELASFRELGDLDNVKLQIQLGKNYLESLRAETIRNYKFTMGKDQADEAILQVLNTAGEEALKAFNKSYKEMAEKVAPLHCADCNSLNITRGSANHSGDSGDSGDPGDSDEHLRRKFSKKPSDIHK